MFENLKKKITEFIALNGVKKIVDLEKDFNKFFSKSKKILLILPTVQEDVNHSIELYSQLKLKGKDIKLLRIAPVKISDLNTVEIVNLMETDFSRLNLPNKDFFKRINSTKFDIVIDLERTNNLISGYITKKINADFKVGFKKENSDLYYNFQVTNSVINSEISYRNLLNSLLMF